MCNLWAPSSQELSRLRFGKLGPLRRPDAILSVVLVTMGMNPTWSSWWSHQYGNLRSISDDGDYPASSCSRPSLGAHIALWHRVLGLRALLARREDC